jgi:hypothetical protein
VQEVCCYRQHQWKTCTILNSFPHFF